MTPRTTLLAAVVVLLLAIGGGAVAWATFLRGDNVAPLTLPSTAPNTASSASPSGSADPSGAATSLPPASGAIDPASIPGTWTIGADSVVGYRVRERLANLSADSDAVGRTSAITGSATIGGTGTRLTVDAAEFSVDMTTLTSDKQMRDNRLRNQGLETDTFTTSTFKLTQPLTIPEDGARGNPVIVTLHGDLTIHGVTKTVDIPAKAQVSGNQIQVAGSLSFPFSDYGIVAPNIANFVTVEDNGTLEFLVILTKG